MAETEPQRFSQEVRVRYCECDPMNVAHHSVYPVWMEIARTEMLRSSGLSYAEMEKLGFFFVVASLSIRYRRPLVYDDLVQVITWVTDVGRARVDHGYELRRAGELMATAQTTLACVDRSGRPCAMPEGLRLA